MTNEEIINKRWKVTDKLLKELYTQVQSIKKETIADLSLLNFDEMTNLRDKISKRTKDIINSKIKEWRKKGYLNGYFGYLVNKRRTNADIINLLILGIYIAKFKEIEEASKEIYQKVANDNIEQAFDDRKEKRKKVSYLLEGLLFIVIVNKTFSDVLEAKSITDADKVSQMIITAIKENKELNKKTLNIVVDKQFNSLINIKEDTQSGLLVDMAYQVGNEAYIKPFQDEKEAQARFVAVIDSRTTLMCKSLNNQVFWVNKENTFYRYSAEKQEIVEMKVKGLVEGVNLPPIDDHFHYCRSTITYQLEPSMSENLREDIKIANKFDKEQYERYKKYFKDEIPNNLEGFIKMKMKDPNKYEQLKNRYFTEKRYYNEKNK